jgi:hypothetical protein
MTKLCILAGNELEAYRWAQSQNLSREQWFYPNSINELLFKKNFHVITVGSVGENSAPDVFEKLYQIALTRGKLGRF